MGRRYFLAISQYKPKIQWGLQDINIYCNCKTQVRSVHEHELYNASIIIFRVHLRQGKGVINVSETQIHDVHTVD